MKTIEILNKTDIRDEVIKELRNRDKLISKIQINEHIKIEAIKHLSTTYKELDKLRKRVLELENKPQNKN